MKFCTNCGSELKGAPKFCPSCGFNLKSNEEKSQPKMHKRVSKSLKDSFATKDPLEIKEFGEQTFETAKESITQPKMASKTSKKRKVTRKKKSGKTTETKEDKSKKLSMWTSVYLVATILLGFAPYSDEKMGLMFFSIIVLLLAILRRNKEKPINLLVKFVLMIQIVFIIAMIGMGFEDGYWPISILYLVVMIIAEVMLMWKGNQKT